MTAPSSTPPRGSRRRSLLALPVLLLVLAGCTGAPSGGSDSSGSTSTQPSTEAEFSAARDAYDRELAQCFRDRGLDVKDPLPGKGITESSAEIQEAYPACAAEIGDPPSSAGIAIDQEQLDKLLAQAACLRDKGYDIKEPAADDPGFIPAEVTDEDFEICRIPAEDS